MPSRGRSRGRSERSNDSRSRRLRSRRSGTRQRHRRSVSRSGCRRRQRRHSSSCTSTASSSIAESRSRSRHRSKKTRRSESSSKRGQPSRGGVTTPEQSSDALSPRIAGLLESAGLSADILRNHQVLTLRDFAYGWDAEEVLLWDRGFEWSQLHKQAVHLAEIGARCAAKAVLWRQEQMPVPAATVFTALAKTKLHQRPSAGSESSARWSRKQVFVSPAALPATAVPSERKRAETLATQVVLLLQEHHVHSTRCEQVASCPEDLKQEMFALFVSKLTSYSPETLRSALAAWRRWSVWCSKRKPPVPVLPAKALHLALFTQSVFRGDDVQRRNAGGPGAVQTVVSGLKFLAEHLGLNVDAGDSLLRVSIAAAPSRLRRLPEHFLLRDFAVFEHLAESQNEVVSFLALCALANSYGGPRFRHMQRSHPDFVRHDELVCLCSQGKVRRGGAPAPPFQWLIPANGIWVRNLAGSLETKWKAITGGMATFLIPALTPYKAPVMRATGFALVPMSAAAWQSTLRALVQLGPPSWCLRPVEPPATKSGRRALATAAQAMGMPLHERLALGNWQDDLAAEPSARFAAPAGSHPVRYAGEDVKLQAQSLAKNKIIAALRAAARNCGEEDIPSWTWGGPLPALLQTLEGTTELAPRHPAFQTLTAPTLQAPALVRAAVANADEPDARPDAEATSLSSSDSSSDDTASEASEAESLEWCLPQGAPEAKLRRAHPTKLTMLGFRRPACCSVSKEPLVGSSFELAMKRHGEHQWCPRCAADLFVRAGEM
ncbi:unnamed protein product [Polarella glacialis]|uniref:Uncharacterized protein n=1 Tax=Polarella glacialis TaxID=89957 RepID=A0A813EK30_POLGL|nr:unnamed protein product [Polarella glacialis]